MSAPTDQVFRALIRTHPHVTPSRGDRRGFRCDPVTFWEGQSGPAKRVSKERRLPARNRRVLSTARKPSRLANTRASFQKRNKREESSPLQKGNPQTERINAL